MGACTSKDKKNDNLNKLIKEKSDDEYLNRIEGILYINENNKNNVIIYFYEDYLYIKNNNFEYNISYYKIKSWKYDEERDIFIFNEIIENNKLDIYYIYINNIEYKVNISDHLKYIIYDHMYYVKDL